MRFRYYNRFVVLLTLWLASLQVVYAQAASASKPAAAVQAVASVSTTVANMNRSVAFYEKVLSFEVTHDQMHQAGDGEAATRRRVVELRLGEESIELVQFDDKPGRPIPDDSRSNDRWFQHIAIIVSDMDRAYSRLNANNVEAASVAPQRLPDWNKNAAGIRAFYFKDPDGHPLEILQFPAGTGDPKWQRSAGRLFLGVDHTAIVVADTEASLKFYRNVLGMHVAGESNNYGPEQESLNNVPGAYLRITSLRAERGPGIELLEYLAPRSGRQLQYTAREADLVHRSTLLLARDPSALAAATRATAVSMAERVGFVTHDPDGHEILISSAETDTTNGGTK